MSAGITCDELRIEVVPRPVEVHRQQEDRIEAVLLAIGLPLHQQHLLGETVRGVRLLGIAVPQVLLAERHGRELRVRAHGPDRHELRDARETGVFDELRAHDQVVVEEPAGVLAVGADAADHGGEVDHEVGARLREHPRDAGFPAQVVLAAARHERLRTAAPAQRLHHEGAEEPGTAGDRNALAVPEARHARRVT